MRGHTELVERGDVAETFPLAFLRDIVRVVQRCDVDVDQQLRRGGISPALLRDDAARITSEQVSRFIQQLWNATDDEFIGLGPHAVPRGTFRLLAIGLVHTSDLASAFERCSEFNRVLPGFPQIGLTRLGETARVRVDLDSAGLEDPLAVGVMLVFVLRFASWLIGQRIVARLVEFPHSEPADPSNLNLVFGSRLRFSAGEAALHFDARHLSSPVVQDERSLETYLTQCPGVWLTRPNFGMTIADQVRNILARGLVGDWPGQADLARSLAMSAQTLRRHLRDEGTSVTAIKEAIQRDTAVASLVDGHESLAHLANRLGFSEPSAFHRAFRRWTGQAPGAYRAAVTSDHTDG